MLRYHSDSLSFVVVVDVVLEYSVHMYVLFFYCSYRQWVSTDVVSSIINMHIETTTIIPSNDEQASTSFADSYNLYEIIGKYVDFFADLSSRQE